MTRERKNMPQVWHSDNIGMTSIDHPGPPKIEKEFGVPIPGEILDPSQWAKTALKKVPAGILDFESLFARAAPIILDLGCGNGRFSLQSALERPDYNHLAVDILPVVIRYATRRGNHRGLANIRFAVIGGRELLAEHIAPASVAEIHCYHPQPFYERHQVHRRLITPEFLSLVHRSLVPGGLFVIQTDNPGYWNYIREVAPVFFEFQEQPGRWPNAPRGRTRREIVALRQGLPVFRGSGRARLNLSADDALALAESLPPPAFDADRRLRQLDLLEREQA
jgi:tRNA (guanine-N7-)-methyltransferase